MSVDTSALAGVTGPTDEQLTEISRLAEMQVALEEQVAALGEELKEKKKELLKVSQEALPEAMKAVNMRSFELADGTKITVRPDVNAYIRKDDQPTVYNWLREHGHGSIIKNEFKIPFGAGEDAKACVLRETLAQTEVDFNENTTIHPGTLKAWVKEQLREANDLPEALNVYEFDVAKVVKG